jgi:hypothetical protein
MRYRLSAALCVAAVALVAAVPAHAFDCHVAKKPTGAGSAGTLDLATGSFTPSKNNPGDEEHTHGGFITFQNPDGDTADTFAHAPNGVLPPVREGGPQDNCDGKGLDALDKCGFFPPEE